MSHGSISHRLFVLIVKLIMLFFALGPSEISVTQSSGSVMDVLGSRSPFAVSQSGGLQPSDSLKTGSVMDILGGGTKTPMVSTQHEAGIKPAASLMTGSVMDILGGGKSKLKTEENFGALSRH